MNLGIKRDEERGSSKLREKKGIVEKKKGKKRVVSFGSICEFINFKYKFIS